MDWVVTLELEDEVILASYLFLEFVVFLPELVILLLYL
jgi:hypothetical protein